MKEWGSTLLASAVIAGIVSAIITGLFELFAVSYKIEQEFRTREAELGYEKLVEANTALWQAQELAKQKGDNAPKLQELRENSDNSYIAARQKIAAFGDAAVIEALSSYYSKHQEAWKPCPDKKKFASDTKIYAAIRNTLGVFRGSVSDEQIANVVSYAV